MPKGYQYRAYTAFPSLDLGQELATKAQLGFADIADNEVDLHSVIKLLGESEHPDYHKYHVVHEMLRRLKWRFHDEVRHQIVAIEEFDLFMAHDGSHLLGMISDDIFEEFLKRLQKECPELKYAQPTVDLKLARQQLRVHVRGGWFGDLQIPDVKSAAIFGANVSDSIDWGRYEQSGMITNLNMQIPFQNEQPLVSVSSGGGVVVYPAYTERDSLDLVRAVQALMQPYTQIITDWSDPAKPA
jgi:hypothetical protein